MDIVMYRGDDQPFTFTITEDGVPVDLSTATIVFTARKTLADVTPTITLSSTGGDIVPDADQTTNPGVLVLTVPAAATADLEGNTTLLCDFEVTDAGAIRTWPEPAFGHSTLIKLRIRADVTHA